MAESSSAQGLDPATKRLLEGPQVSAPESPSRRAATAQSVEAQSPEVALADKAPSAKEVAELSEVTLEAGPTLLELSEQARRSQVNGEIFRCVDVLEPRLRAIEWFTSQFNAFGYRDEWLSEAVNYIDRVAAAWCTGTSSGSSSDALQEDTRETAKQVMACKELWLAAVQVALKMSEAEAELDSTVQDLVLPLVSFGQAGYRCDRSRWNQILAAEMKLVDKLNFCLVVPNALQLVDRLAHDVCRVARVDSRWQLSGMADEALDRACWAGLEEGQLPLLRGPPLKCKEIEEKRINDAMPKRRLTHFQALARFLAELTVVHKPRDAYGDENHPCVLAVAVVQLALHSFKGAGPPEACVAELDKIQAQMLTDVKVTEEILPDLLASIYRLWSRLPQSSPVLKKWRAREEHLGGALPSAPSKAQLPTELQKSCCAFSTPQRRRQKVEIRGTSSTPCGKQPPPSAGRPSSLEPRCPGSGGSGVGAAAEADSSRPDDSAAAAEALASSRADAEEAAKKMGTKPQQQPATGNAPMDITAAAAAVAELPVSSGSSPQPDSPSNMEQCQAEATELVAAPSPQPAVSLLSSVDATPSASSSAAAGSPEAAAAVAVDTSGPARRSSEVENTSPCSEASSQSSSQRTVPLGKALMGFGKVSRTSLLRRPSPAATSSQAFEIPDDPEEAAPRHSEAMNSSGAAELGEQQQLPEQQPQPLQDDEQRRKLRRLKRPSPERVDSAPLEHGEVQLETQQSEPSQENQQLQPHQPLADEAASRPSAAMDPAGTNTECGEQSHSLKQQPPQLQDDDRQRRLKRLKRPSEPEDPVVGQRDEQLVTQQSEPSQEIPQHQQQPNHLMADEGTSPEQRQQQPPQLEPSNRRRRLRLIDSSSRQEVASSPDDVVDLESASSERECREPLLPVEHARAGSDTSHSPELQSTPEQDQRLQNTRTLPPDQQLQNTPEQDQQPRPQGHSILLPVQVEEEDGEEEAPKEEDEDEAMSCNPSQNSAVSRDSYNLSEEGSQAMEILETTFEQEEQDGEEKDKDEREKQASEDMLDVDEEEKVKRGSEDEREWSPEEEAECEVVEDDADEFANREGEMQLQQPQERQHLQEQQCLPPLPAPEAESKRPKWQSTPWQRRWQHKEQQQQRQQRLQLQWNSQQQQQQRQLQPQLGQLPASSVVVLTGVKRVAEPDAPITEPEIPKKLANKEKPDESLRVHARSRQASQMWLKVFHTEWGCGKCRWQVCTPSCWKAREKEAELRRMRAVVGKMARRKRCLAAPTMQDGRSSAQALTAPAAIRDKKFKRKIQKFQKTNVKKSYMLRDSASRSRPRPIASPSAGAVVTYTTTCAAAHSSVAPAVAQPWALTTVAQPQAITAVAQPQVAPAVARSQAITAVAQPQAIPAVAQQEQLQLQLQLTLQLPSATALVPRAEAGPPPPTAATAGTRSSSSKVKRPKNLMKQPFAKMRKQYSQRQRKPFEEKDTLALNHWTSPEKKDLARSLQQDKRHRAGPVRPSAASSSSISPARSLD